MDAAEVAGTAFMVFIFTAVVADSRWVKVLVGAVAAAVSGGALADSGSLYTGIGLMLCSVIAAVFAYLEYKREAGASPTGG